MDAAKLRTPQRWIALGLLVFAVGGALSWSIGAVERDGWARLIIAWILWSLAFFVPPLLVIRTSVTHRPGELVIQNWATKLVLKTEEIEAAHGYQTIWRSYRFVVTTKDGNTIPVRAASRALIGFREVDTGAELARLLKGDGVATKFSNWE